MSRGNSLDYAIVQSNESLVLKGEVFSIHYNEQFASLLNTILQLTFCYNKISLGGTI